MADQQTPPAGAPPTGGSVNPWLGILAGLGGAIGGRAIANNSASGNVPPELRQLLSQQVERQAYQNPNFQAVTQGVHAMLPGFATQGTSMGPGLSNTPPPMPSGGSGSNPLSNPLLSGALGKALGDMAGGNIPFKDIIDKLKILFSHGRTVQGNKPYPGGALPSGNPGMNGFTGWGDNGNTGQLTGDYSGPFEGGLNPQVNTDWMFNGVPGGWPNEPENPASAAPNWWEQLPTGGNSGGGASGSSDIGDWWDE